VQQKFVYEKANKQEKIQESGMYQKCLFDQFHNTQNRHQQSQQDQAMKKWNAKS
jgi:hypothetical protein